MDRRPGDLGTAGQEVGERTAFADRIYLPILEPAPRTDRRGGRGVHHASHGGNDDPREHRPQAWWCRDGRIGEEPFRDGSRYVWSSRAATRFQEVRGNHPRGLGSATHGHEGIGQSLTAIAESRRPTQSVPMTIYLVELLAVGSCYRLADIPRPESWRILTVSASAFPKGMGVVDRHYHAVVERAEWLA